MMSALLPRDAGGCFGSGRGKGVGSLKGQAPGPSLGDTKGVTSGVQLIAAHFAQQQDRLRRNMCLVASDEEWKDHTKRRFQNCCGTFVFFKRSGCPSCNCMAPKVHEASNDFELRHGEQVKFLEVDVDRCPRAANSFHVDFVPTFCVFRHGVLEETFSGVSSNVFSGYIDSLSMAVASCVDCNAEACASFNALRAHLAEVIHHGCLSDGSTLRVLTANGPVGEVIPSGKVVMPFDTIHSSNEPIPYRVELVSDLLRRSAPPTQHCRSRARMMIFELMEDMPDEGLDISQSVRSAIHKWLISRRGHPSLWSVDEWQALTLGTDAFLSRRAIRAECWLLRGIMATSGRRSAIKHWSSELRSLLCKDLEKLWSKTRPCNRICSFCELPCSAAQGHEGPHSCGSEDHQCHRPAPPPACSSTAEAASEDEIGEERCFLHSGHRGPCRRRPTLWNMGDAGVCPICLELLPALPSEPHSEGIAGDAPSGAFPDACDDDSSTLAMLLCGHTFHASCAGSWLRRCPSCPVCRSPTNSTSSASLAAKASSPRLHSGSFGQQPPPSLGRDRREPRRGRLAPLREGPANGVGNDRFLMQQTSVGVLRPRDLPTRSSRSVHSSERDTGSSSSVHLHIDHSTIAATRPTTLPPLAASLDRLVATTSPASASLTPRSISTLPSAIATAAPSALETDAVPRTIIVPSITASVPPQPTASLSVSLAPLALAGGARTEPR